MVEDEPVNTGAVVWPGGGGRRERYDECRRSCTGGAREDPSSADSVICTTWSYDPAFLVDAFERVAGNQGSKTAGVDGWTVAAHPLLDRGRGVPR